MSSSISWTDATLNHIVGCDKVSFECDNCYAVKMAYRQEAMGRSQYQGTTTYDDGVAWTGVVNRAPDHVLQAPLKQDKPTIYFVSSMGDYFHKNAKDNWRLEVLKVAEQCPHHVFMIPTKRVQNIMPFLKRTGITLPPNVWIGVSVGSRKAVKRIELLKKVPASILFISAEPVLEDLGEIDLAGIDFVAVGGESGPGARLMKASWVRKIRRQCKDAGAIFHFKQWGTYPGNNPIARKAPPNVNVQDWVAEQDPHGKGGALLDGKLYREMPKMRRSRS